MRTKILILGLIFLVLFACEKGIENPYSPEPPSPASYIYCDINVTMGIALSDITPFQNENDYLTFYLAVADLHGGGGLLPLTITHKNPSNSSNKTVEVKLDLRYNLWNKNASWELAVIGSSISSEWLMDAQFQCWLQLIPVCTEIRIEPPEQQIIFTGWTLDEFKTIYFTIIKE